MDRDRVARLLAMFEGRGEVEALDNADSGVGVEALTRSEDRLSACELLLEAGHWELTFTTAYDAYRMAAESSVLAVGYRVPAVPGAHRITLDIAGAVVGENAVFAGAAAERFRTERHQLEYFDTDKSVEKNEVDARWAVDKATAAVIAVAAMLNREG